MELFLSRREIRRRMLARLGNSTNDSQSPLVMEQYNEFIRAAAEEVYLRCPWSQSMRETFVEIGIDQRYINYPELAGPGQIQAIGVWMEGEQRYRPLRRGRIPIILDDEPIVEEGEPTSIDGRGTPSIYELKKQIELWCRADQAYELKIDHTIQPNFESDDSVSVVDAEAICLYAMSDAYAFQGDVQLATDARNKFEARINRLIGDQAPLTPIRRGRLDRLSLRRNRGWDYIPDSGLWPSRFPPP